MRRIPTHDCEGCDVAGSNSEHRGPTDAQRNKEIEEESIRRSARRRTENLHTQDKARERRQESEGGSRQGTSLRVCTSVTRHERVLRSEQQRG